MSEKDKQEMDIEQKRSADSIKLAILLGLVSAGIYVIYIVWHFL